MTKQVLVLVFFGHFQYFLVIFSTFLVISRAGRAVGSRPQTADWDPGLGSRTGGTARDHGLGSRTPRDQESTNI